MSVIGGSSSCSGVEVHPLRVAVPAGSAGWRQRRQTSARASHPNDGFRTRRTDGTASPSGTQDLRRSRPSSGDEVGRRRFRFVVQPGDPALAARAFGTVARVLRRRRHGGAIALSAHRRASRWDVRFAYLPAADTCSTDSLPTRRWTIRSSRTRRGTCIRPSSSSSSCRSRGFPSMWSPSWRRSSCLCCSA